MFRAALFSLLFGILAGCQITWNPVPGRGGASGIVDSQDDIIAGKPKLYINNPHHAEEWCTDYWQILKDDYGIEVQTVMFIHDNEIQEYMAAYNDNIEKRLESSYGVGFLKVAEDKAVKQWLARN